jgi:hypothetical protein
MHRSAHVFITPLVLASLLSAGVLSACVEEDSLEQSLAPAALVTITARQILFNGQPVTTQAATLAAYQQGDGPWQPMTLQNGAYSAAVEPGRYAVAMAYRFLETPSSEQSFVELQHATTDELRDLTFHMNFTIDEPYRLLLDLRGIAADQIASVTFNRTRLQLGNGVHTLRSPLSSGELMVVLQRPTPPGGPLQPTEPLKLFRLASVNLLDSAPIVVDFNLPLAAPLNFPATLGAPGGLIISSVTTANGSFLLGRSASTFYALPPALARPGDLPRVAASTPFLPSGPLQNLVFAPLAPGPQTLQYAVPLPLPVPTTISYPHRRPVFTLAHAPGQLPLTDYEYQLWSLAYDEHRSLATEWALTFTAGWILGAPSPRYEAPVLSSIPGWSPALAFLPGFPLDWRTARVDQNTRTLQPGQLLLTTAYSGSLAN